MNILHIVTNVRVSNGVTNVIMNQYDKLIRSGHNIDFISMYDRESPHLARIKENGGNYYLLPQDGDKPNQEESYKFIDRILASRKYDIVHTNITGRYAVMATKLAKKHNVPYRIYHTHSMRDFHNLHSILYTLFYDTQCVWFANRYLACSDGAGRQMFGLRKYCVVKNTINTKNMQFDMGERKRLRLEYNISEDCLAFGTVCRQTYIKNPFFLIDIFAELHNKQKNSIFMWAGTGEMEQEVKEYATSKGLKGSVIFLGNQLNMRAVYSAYDCFVLPSKAEGFGLVYIEAQSCGLPTFASDKVPKETRVSDLISYFSLSKSAKEWADYIWNTMSDIKFGVDINRQKHTQEVVDKGFDTEFNNDLIDYYENIERI